MKHTTHPLTLYVRRAARIAQEFERRGRDIAGDIEVLSREWTRLWVISVAVSLCILAADSQAETPC